MYQAVKENEVCATTISATSPLFYILIIFKKVLYWLNAVYWLNSQVILKKEESIREIQRGLCWINDMKITIKNIYILFLRTLDLKNFSKSKF